MTTLTIKNIPETLYQDLKQQASDNHRSINSEVIFNLTLAVHKSHASADDILTRARAVRLKQNQKINLTDDMIKQLKNQDRL